jgi:hypothetical protein
MQIVSNPERVCLEHALEFWTGLLVYAKDHSDPYGGRAHQNGELSRPPVRRRETRTTFRFAAS